MSSIRPLKLSEIRNYRKLYQDANSFYVVNTTDRSASKRRAEVLMTFVLNGTERTITIPNTWIPIDLTAQVNNIDDILKNEDFLSHIRRQYLVVIDPEIAENELLAEDADAEYKRINGIDDGEHGNFDLRSLKEAKTTMKRDKASPTVLNIMNKKDITESQKLGALKAIERSLKDDDYKFIIKTAKNDDLDKIRSWAGRNLDASIMA